MKLSTKGRYAMIALADLSKRGPEDQESLAELSPRQDISHAIRVTEVLEAVDETMDALSRGAGASGAASGTDEQLLTDKLWETLSAQVYVLLHQTRLSVVVRNQMAPCPAVPAFVELVDE